MFRWQPPTIAEVDSPARKLWHAKWRATKLAEQAVSAVKLGPLRSKKCESLLDCIAWAHPKPYISAIKRLGYRGYPHTCGLVHGNRVAVPEQVTLVLGEAAADEDTDVFSNNRVLRNTSVLEGLECALKQKTLLGVHGNGLLLCQTEEGGIERRQVDVQEVTTLCVVSSSLARVRVVECFVVEALLGHGSEAGSGTGAQLPELGGAGNAAGHTAGHTDDGDGHLLQAGVTAADGVGVALARRMSTGTAVGVAVGVTVC